MFIILVKEKYFQFNGRLSVKTGPVLKHVVYSGLSHMRMCILDKSSHLIHLG